VKESLGVKLLPGTRPGHLLLELPSGAYRFQSTLPHTSP
jgi:hypothetical protein